MTASKRFVLVLVSIVFAAGFVLGGVMQPWDGVSAQSNDRVFELRTYTAQEGKLDALQARFRDHSVALLAKHGMPSLGYWVPVDAPLSDNTLIYILEHDSREAAAANWESFGKDPDWRRVAEESQRDGRLVTSVVSVYMGAADYSPTQ